jgi:glycosyltransferase involved in cell wall biosynthesis
VSKKPVNILYIIGQLGLGGSENQLLDLIRRLPPQEYRLYICSLWCDMLLAPEFLKAGVEIAPFHKSRHIDISIVWKLCNFIRHKSIDIAHCIMFSGTTWGRLSAILAGVPIIIASERNVDIWKTWPYWIIDNILAPFTNIIIENSKSVKLYYCRHVKGSIKKSVVVYNGVDINRFVRDDNIRSTERRRLQILESAPVVGIVANLSQNKDYPNLLNSAVLIRKIVPSINILIVGEGKERLKLIKLTQELGLTNCVKFLGLCREVEKILPIFDVFVLPSAYEGFSNVIIEAMACGLPVVATNVGGNAEAVVEGETGFVVPPHSSELLAERVIELLIKTDLAKQMGNRGRERVESMFNMEKMVNAYDILYQGLLDREKKVSKSR